TIFNRTIVLYNIATFVAAIAFFIFDLSKIFMTIGILHNLFEFVIVMVIISGGKFNRIMDYIWPTLYILTFSGISLFTKWPIDAILFKFQGNYLFIFKMMIAVVVIGTETGTGREPILKEGAGENRKLKFIYIIYVVEIKSKIETSSSNSN